MEKIQTLAHINNDIFYTSPFFGYLSQKESLEITEKFDRGTSFCVGFYQNNILIVASIIDLEGYDYIHIREVDGAMKKGLKYLETFVVGLAKATNKKYVSVGTNKKTLQYIALKMGWTRSEENNYEFLKKV